MGWIKPRFDRRSSSSTTTTQRQWALMSRLPSRRQFDENLVATRHRHRPRCGAEFGRHTKNQLQKAIVTVLNSQTKHVTFLWRRLSFGAWHPVAPNQTRSAEANGDGGLAVMALAVAASLQAIDHRQKVQREPPSRPVLFPIKVVKFFDKTFVTLWYLDTMIKDLPSLLQ